MLGPLHSNTELFVYELSRKGARNFSSPRLFTYLQHFFQPGLKRLKFLSTTFQSFRLSVLGNRHLHEIVNKLLE